MPKELVSQDGKLAWAAAHSAYGKVLDTKRDPGAEARFGDGLESPFRMLGRVVDHDAELCFTRFRCFDQDTGSWISTDPL